MKETNEPLSKLINNLKKLPGIGQKSAQRIAYYILKKGNNFSYELGNAILEAGEKITYCKICNNFTTTQPCSICADINRNSSKLCIVEQPFNIFSIEKTGLFKGKYHVLLGKLSPLEGIGPDELKISNLIKRIEDENIKEIILALSPTTEGNATSHYLIDLLKDFDIKITRISFGLPIGSDIDYVDSITIAKALEDRIEIKK